MSNGFLFAADLHLQPAVWASHPELAGDTWYGFQQLVDYCQRDSCDLVLGGDIFDSDRPDSASVLRFCQGVQQLQMRGLRIYYVNGNHDMVVGGPPWPAIGGAIWLHGAVHDIGGVRVRGMDFMQRTQLAAYLAGVEFTDCSVLVAHQTWLEIAGKLLSHGPLAAIRGNISLVLSGDYHVPVASRQITGATGAFQFMSPGSVSMQAITECTSKAAIRVMPPVAGVESRCPVTTWVPLQSRPVMTYQIPDEAGLREFMQAIKQDIAQTLINCREYPDVIRKPLCIVRHSPLIPGMLRKIESAVGNDVFLFARMLIGSSVPEIEMSPERGLFSDLSQVVEETTPPGDIRDGLMRLLRVDDVSAEVGKLITDYMADLPAV